jgi:hypothetical protein
MIDNINIKWIKYLYIKSNRKQIKIGGVLSGVIKMCSTIKLLSIDSVSTSLTFFSVLIFSSIKKL